MVIDLGDIIRSSQQDSTTPSTVTSPIKQSGQSCSAYHSSSFSMGMQASMQGNSAFLDAMYSSSGRPSISTNTLLPPGSLG
ncbi:hypothetical protein EON63_21585, partial [archaeon]